ncbi:MAG: hypothetical protein CVV06_11875 [Gammaproteobacteria bacterium HGW-Gammaproteobacteria-10]|nr:MAG: hypothetical protein CVV06_11875 [Gammaproteobacteria bacterium HGW-Gammaproteobacteria-10]
MQVNAYVLLRYIKCVTYMPFALQISAMPEEVPGCSISHLTRGEGPAWSWHRAYRDVFTQHLNKP